MRSLVSGGTGANVLNDRSSRKGVVGSWRLQGPRTDLGISSAAQASVLRHLAEPALGSGPLMPELALASASRDHGPGTSDGLVMGNSGSGEAAPLEARDVRCVLGGVIA